MAYKTKANPGKKKAVAELVTLMKKYPIIGLLDVENLPTAQFQNMRANLRGSVEIKISKKSLIMLAIEQCKGDKAGIETLLTKIKGMPGLLFTTENPFKLYKTIQKNKSAAPAKGGQVAPKDIIVQAGPTGFAPGPIIGELGQFKIKTGVEAGKLVIKADTVVAKEGDVISAGLASVLLRLNIQPMEVGLDVVAVYDQGVIYSKSALDVDENKIRADAELFARQALNLAVSARIFVKESIVPLMAKAAAEARAISMEANFMTEDTKGDILAKAEGQANSLNSELV